MTFKQLCETTGCDIRSYSGCGRYGDKCIGIDIDRGSSLGGVISDLLDTAIDIDFDTGTNDATTALSKALHDMTTDSMGLGMIVYFPSIVWED